MIAVAVDRRRGQGQAHGFLRPRHVGMALWGAFGGGQGGDKFLLTMGDKFLNLSQGLTGRCCLTIESGFLLARIAEMAKLGDKKGHTPMLTQNSTTPPTRYESTHDDASHTR